MGAPAWVVPVFVEHDDGTWFDAMTEDFEDGAGGGVEVAVDVEKGDIAGVGVGEAGEALVEPAADEAGVFGHVGRVLGEHAGWISRSPLFGEAFETVEAEDGFLPVVGDDAEGAAGGDAEFEDEAVAGGAVEAGAEEVVVVGVAGGVGGVIGDVGGGIEGGCEGHDVVDVEGIV